MPTVFEIDTTQDDMIDVTNATSIPDVPGDQTYFLDNTRTMYMEDVYSFFGIKAGQGGTISGESWS